jgi:hypothetical protein
VATQPLKARRELGSDAAAPGLSGKARKKSLIFDRFGTCWSFHLAHPTLARAFTGTARTGLLDSVLGPGARYLEPWQGGHGCSRRNACALTPPHVKICISCPNIHFSVSLCRPGGDGREWRDCRSAGTDGLPGDTMRYLHSMATSRFTNPAVR